MATAVSMLADMAGVLSVGGVHTYGVARFVPMLGEEVTPATDHRSAEWDCNVRERMITVQSAPPLPLRLQGVPMQLLLRFYVGSQRRGNMRNLHRS